MSKRKWSQSNLAHAFKIAVETALRDANLLPELSEPDAFLEELTHQFRLIQIPQRKITDMSLLQAPILEDENEANSNLPPPESSPDFFGQLRNNRLLPPSGGCHVARPWHPPVF